ncbi:MAG TPA: hypothetical protein VE954_36620 [Oligoflexus sp.]|uniref:hypothetical protein n=1 Tax=Oligoflexus sp. TaxID=1971216 RepID=UPI002D4042CA|nr:hypothetical protein [Oligoflexus sp.]HYX38661.1 hypothetical protein [Oligoflexus sp.]
MSEKKTTFDFLSDPPYQKREGLFERIGWVFMGLLVLAAALGLFGKGMLAHAELKEDTFHLYYDRFIHYGDLSTIRLEVPASTGEPGVVAVALSNSYLHNFRIEHIVPEPESSAHGDQTLFWFTTTHTGQPVSIQLRMEPEKVGRLEGKIFVNGEQGHVFHQFVYP